MQTTKIKILYTLILLLLLTGCSQKSGQPNGMKNGKWKMGEASPVEVEVIEAKPATFTKNIEAIGSLESPNTVELTSDNKGKVIEIDIPEGVTVNKGHVLARIDDSTNIAEIKVAKAKLKNAEGNYKRMKALQEEGAISKQTLDNALEVYESAKGELERAESIQLMSVIEAPFDGVLSFRKISVGTFIAPGDPIVRISQINPLDLVFSLPEKYTNDIKIGQKVKFTVEKQKDSKEYFGIISAMDPYIDEETRAVKIKAKVNNPNKELLPGRFANVFLDLETKQNAIILPQEALIQEGSEKKVFIVDKKEKASLHKVTIGDWTEDSVVILHGINPGDIVITSGHQKLQAGSKVIQKPYNKVDNKTLDIGLNNKG